MIVARIPKEIRSYKEKIAWGLTMRQMIAGAFAAATSVPLFIWGKGVFGEGVTEWLVILCCVPAGFIGFYKKQGMPLEKYAWNVLSTLFLRPRKRPYKSDNFFRRAIALEEKSELQGKNISKLKKMKDQAALEKVFLVMEAEEKGEKLDFNEIEDSDLLTVRMPSSPKNKNDKDKDTKKTKEKDFFFKLYESKALKVREKQSADPYYNPSKIEGFYIKQFEKALTKERKKEIEEAKKKINTRNSKMKNRRTAKSFIPKSSQDTIPYVADYEDGLFEVEPNKYSKCYKIVDINYLTATDESQSVIFERWGEFLNYFSEDVFFALCIDNRVISKEEQERRIFYKETGDNLDRHRKEYNKILRRQITAGKNDIRQGKYILVTIEANSPFEALIRFKKLDMEVVKNLKRIGSNGTVMSTEERLELLHDKFRKGREGEFSLKFFDDESKTDFYDFLKSSGLSSKDYIAPSSFGNMNEKDHFMIEDQYYRCMFLSNLPASLSDDLLYQMTDVSFPVIASLNFQPVDQGKALRLVKKQITGMEANKMQAEQRNSKSGYSTDTISHDLKHSYEEGLQLLDDLLNNDQKTFFVTIAFMIHGSSLENLNANCKELEGKARSKMCQLMSFDFQQEKAMQVILPMGITPSGKIFVDRTLTTASTSVLMPFSAQELFQEGGYYYGLNQLSRNLILCDRKKMKTPSGFVLGSSGSGKSFAVKREILNVLLSDGKTGVLVIDPENEYTDFALVFGGTILTISTGTDTYINPMDMNENYGLDDKDDPLTTPMAKKKKKALNKKSDYLVSIVQSMLMDESGKASITPGQKSIIDRCVTTAYKDFLDHNFDYTFIPTLVDVQNLFEQEESEEGKKLADAVAYYTKGNMNIFSHKTNIDYNNRFVVFNIRDLGTQMKQLALLVVLDFIWNRMVSNSQQKVRTCCYVDEIHVLFANDFSAQYLKQLYKRGRKYGLIITGITQDIEEILKSETAKGMISNSEFILMLNQKSENLKILAEMFSMSEAQISYINNADPGSGLLFAEKVIVPFVDNFPETSYLYKLISTAFDEDNSEAIKKLIDDMIKEQERSENEEQEEKETEKIAS